MSESMRTRYPGAHPFSDDELSSKLFFGREAEITSLTHQIIANRLVVLFARSGLGKTSLINAGIAGKLRAKGFLPLTVRLNDVERGPLGSIYRGIESYCAEHGVEYVQGPQDSLWRFFTTAQFWSKDLLMTPVLILDQFEELFTLQSEENANAFLDEFSFLVRGIPPSTSENEQALADSPPPIRILISIREDFLADLEQISDRIPEILDKRFRLLPLKRESAADALESPAKLENASLATLSFGISEDTKEAILDMLDRRHSPSSLKSAGSIEPFQLQLICQRIEEVARLAQNREQVQRVVVSLADIGGKKKLSKVLEQFYKTRIRSVPSWFQRKKVRRLCSEFLISPSGRRLRLEESEVLRLTGVKASSLQVLVDQRLLRRENTADGCYYELSHDSLVAPVLDSTRIRFVVRLLFLILMLVLGGIVCSVFWQVIEESLFDIQNMTDPEKISEEIGGMIFVMILLGMTLRWAWRKVRIIRELWRRSRA